MPLFRSPKKIEVKLEIVYKDRPEHFLWMEREHRVFWDEQYYRNLILQTEKTYNVVEKLEYVINDYKNETTQTDKIKKLFVMLEYFRIYKAYIPEYYVNLFMIQLQRMYILRSYCRFDITLRNYYKLVFGGDIYKIFSDLDSRNRFLIIDNYFIYNGDINLRRFLFVV
jgi:hypothetical protein